MRQSKFFNNKFLTGRLTGTPRQTMANEKGRSSRTRPLSADIEMPALIQVLLVDFYFYGFACGGTHNVDACTQSGGVDAATGDVEHGAAFGRDYAAALGADAVAAGCVAVYAVNGCGYEPHVERSHLAGILFAVFHEYGEDYAAIGHFERTVIEEFGRGCQGCALVSGVVDRVGAFGQGVVGGKIEMVSPFTESAAIICNAEGKNLNLPPNRLLCDCYGDPYDVLCGTFLIVGVGGENFISLTDFQLRSYKEMFDHPHLLAIPLEVPDSPEKPTEQKKKRGKTHER